MIWLISSSFTALYSHSPKEFLSLVAQLAHARADELGMRCELALVVAAIGIEVELAETGATFVDQLQRLGLVRANRPVVMRKDFGAVRRAFG